MGQNKRWLSWEYCECGCHCLVASVGSHHYAAYTSTHGDKRGRVHVFDGGCGQRLSRYYREYQSFGQADYQTYRRAQKAVQADFRAAQKAGLL